MEIDLDLDLDLWKITLIGILIIAGVSIGYAILTFVYPLHSTGKIRTIGVEIKDVNGTIIKNIDWGDLTPNSTKHFTIYVVNNGTVPITLNFETENWNPPEALSYVTLTWNYSGNVIDPKSSQLITLTLTVAENAHEISNFSFDIKIIAQEVTE